MSDQYVGEIRMFAGRYAPVGWVFCDGSLLQISNYQVLYTLLGTTYGGDGASTFAVPDLRARLPVGQGQGAGLTARARGQMFGATTVALDTSQIPSHTHAFNAASNAATSTSPDGGLIAATVPNTAKLYAAADPAKQKATLSSDMISIAGQSAPHNNVMPTLCVNFIIATQGIYPQQQ